MVHDFYVWHDRGRCAPSEYVLFGLLAPIVMIDVVHLHPTFCTAVDSQPLLPFLRVPPPLGFGIPDQGPIRPEGLVSR